MAGAGIRVGVLGAGGRMGAAVIAAVAADPRLKMCGAAERAGDPAVGTRLANGLTICANTSAMAHGCNVLIDFTAPVGAGGQPRIGVRQ